jgi:hypothetical protein
MFLGNVKKAIIACAVLTGFQQICYANLERLYGHWIDTATYNRIVANPENTLANAGILIPYDWFVWNRREMREEYGDIEAHRLYFVNKVEWISENEAKIMFIHHINNSQSEQVRMIIQVVSDDVINIFSDSHRDKPRVLHRITNWQKKPVQTGLINMNGVRMYVKPDVQSDAWLVFNEYCKVEVIGRSIEKQTIGGVEAYWYEVRWDYEIDGWVFGAYLDLEDPDYFDG